MVALLLSNQCLKLLVSDLHGNLEADYLILKSLVLLPLCIELTFQARLVESFNDLFIGLLVEFNSILGSLNLKVKLIDFVD
jgi:hypothetical protein